LVTEDTEPAFGIAAGILASNRVMMVSEEWLEDYCERHLNRQLPTHIDSALADRIRTCLRLGLKRLNALPADDPFWAGTNKEPTLHKLAQYFSERLDREENVWIYASYLLLLCSDGNLGRVLKPLMEQDFAAVEWVVAAGRWIRLNSGFSAKSTLRDLLIDLRSRLPELTPKLDALRQNASAHRLWMIDEAINLKSQDWADALTPP
jgi:hypothetical protein